MPPTVQVPEPGNFFEAQAVQQQIARFSGKAIGADASGSVEDASGSAGGKPEQPQEMQMLPWWRTMLPVPGGAWRSMLETSPLGPRPTHRPAGGAQARTFGQRRPVR